MTTMTPPFAPPAAAASKRWYQEPYVWLVLGGPLAVIVASMVTVYLAVTHVDPVLERKPMVPSEKLVPSERAAAERSVMPAGQARNHVVSPTLPKN